MGKKKNKSKNIEKILYLIELRDGERVSWWDDKEKNWTTNPLKATDYFGFKAADDVVERFIHLLSGNTTVEQVPRSKIIENLVVNNDKELNVKKKDKEKKRKSYISPGTVFLDRHFWNSPVPLLVTDIFDDTKELAIAKIGLITAGLLREKMQEVLDMIDYGIYEVLWDPDRMIVPESNDEFMNSIGLNSEQLDVIVPGCILLGPGEFISDIPYMVDKIVGTDVLLLHPGVGGHKIYSIKDVRSDIAAGHWEIIYDPRIGTGEIYEDDKVP